MKKLTLLLVCLTLIIGASAQFHIWTDHTKSIDYAMDNSDCDNIQFGPLESIYPSLGEEFRYTIINEKDAVHFHVINLDVWPATHTMHWELERLTGPYLPDLFTSDAMEFTEVMNKRSSDKTVLFEKYAVRLYSVSSSGKHGLMDEMEVYVLPEAKGWRATYSEGFDVPLISSGSRPDDLGHYKATSYPEFSGNGNVRCDLNSFPEKMADMCRYPTHFTNSSIGGIEAHPHVGDGCLCSILPSTQDVKAISETVDLSQCQYYNPNTYDHCEDRCNLNAFQVPYDQYVHPAASIASKNELNAYSHQVAAKKMHYGLSIKIPLDFEEEGFEGPNGELGQDRWHIIASFHQANWPIPSKDIQANCNSTLQVLYLGNNQIAFQYGILGFNRTGFGPFTIEKGEWFDLVFEIKWGQLNGPSTYGAYGEDSGSLSIWCDTGHGYGQLCLMPATDFFRSHQDFSEQSKNLSPFTTDGDYSVVYGPNVENVNPPYLALNQMRGGSDGTHGYNYATQIFYDELRIAPELDDVMIGEMQSSISNPGGCDPSWLETEEEDPTDEEENDEGGDYEVADDGKGDSDDNDQGNDDDDDQGNDDDDDQGDDDDNDQGDDDDGDQGDDDDNDQGDDDDGDQGDDDDDDQGDDDDDQEDDDDQGNDNDDQGDDDDDQGDDDDDQDDDGDQGDDNDDQDDDGDDSTCEGSGPQLYVFPNPVTTDKLTIHLGLLDTDLAGDITLFSFMGIPLFTWTIPPGMAGEYQFTFDASMIPPGSYNLSWTSADWNVDTTIIFP
jgi:hypothetical protein